MAEEKGKRGQVEPESRIGGSPLLSAGLYLASFFLMYWALGSAVAPYLSLDLAGRVMTFGSSGTLCWVSFAAAMLVGLFWAYKRNPALAVLAALLASTTAAGVCVLGYSLLAIPYAAPVILLGGIAACVPTCRCGVSTIVRAAVAGAMLVSLLLFAGLASGALSIRNLPDAGDDGTYWGQLSALAADEADGLGISDVDLRVGPLPRKEIARYSHSSGTVTVSASALQGAASESELKEGVLHAIAHCAQARLQGSFELWAGIEDANISLWLEETDGACPPNDVSGNSLLADIESRADDYARERLWEV